MAKHSIERMIRQYMIVQVPLSPPVTHPNAVVLRRGGLSMSFALTPYIYQTFLFIYRIAFLSGLGHTL